jgi:hypothetical protein
MKQVLMVKTKENKKTNSDEVLNLNELNVVFEEQKVLTPTFVVTRGGLRVSDMEYPSNSDSLAIAEKGFWQRIVKKYPDGTKVEIVMFDKKKHRVW